MMMGFGDEALGTFGGLITMIRGEGFDKGYDKLSSAMRGSIDQFAERRPNEAMALEVAGAIPTIIGGGLAAKGVSTAVPLIGKMAQKAGPVATSALGGAGYGAASGFGEGEGDVTSRLKSAGTGALIGAGTGAAAGALGQGIGKIAGRAAGRRAVPTTQQWEDQASALYQTADNLGVAVGGRALGRIGTIRQNIGKLIADPNVAPEAFKELYPKTLASLQILDAIAKNPTMTLRNVESYRGMLLDAAFDAATPKDGRYAGIILRKFDDWAGNIHPTEYVGANAAGPDASRLYKEARRLWRIKSKAQTIEAVIKRAGDDTVDTPGNAAFAQALVTGFKRLQRNDALMAGFSDAEKQVIRDAAGGKLSQRTLKGIDMITPGISLGRATQAGGWALLGGPAAIPALAAGTGSRVARNRSIIKSADRASEFMRNDGVLPFDPIAAKAMESYATRLFSAGGQSGAMQFLPEPHQGQGDAVLGSMTVAGRP